ncbi:MAG: SAM-dependent chlorinase/fluorinase [Planctomycetes bacterium]|nr:SAM-dependent chlorinase/fluorinase [Planctomycetota bacterium]
MPPLVTLTTDFGSRDGFVGVMKGVILGIAPDARIVDLSHEVAPQSVREAAFLLQAAWPYFPGGTVHVVVVDPGVGSDRAILAARRRGQVFLAPDNGALTGVLEADGEAVEIRRLQAARFALPKVCATFHGRDVFAPAAAHLLRGFPFEDAGPLLPGWRRLPLPKSEATSEGAIRGEVVLVDRFGNLVTNVGASALAGLGPASSLVVEVGGEKIRGLVPSYRYGELGRAAALVSSFDTLEIAVPMGSAAASLGVGVGAAVVVRRS